MKFSACRSLLRIVSQVALRTQTGRAFDGPACDLDREIVVWSKSGCRGTTIERILDLSYLDFDFRTIPWKPGIRNSRGPVYPQV